MEIKEGMKEKIKKNEKKYLISKAYGNSDKYKKI
jgi:hypothetical protein